MLRRCFCSSTIVLFIVFASACTTPAERDIAEPDLAAARSAVSGVLDALHHNASLADEEPYFALFATNAVFLGTDGTERWTVDEFRGYVHPYFDRGQGWTYTLREGRRKIEFDATGSVAWFDEVLDNDNYGECRGTGVLELVDGQWKIAQYNLTIPIPNALANDVVAMIHGAMPQ